MYSPLVRKGGVVVFHDIAQHDPKVGCEVDKFWNEIKQSHAHAEMVEDTKPRMGWRRCTLCLV